MIANSNQLQKSLAELKQEQARLTEAIRIIEELVSGTKSNRLSPAGRARISEAARKRWEEHRRRASRNERHAA
ncbi:MAG TPA: hypothetical protein VN709_06700 [Terriglobales bacterium]|nr:hypothetical protein [Terriglobales bacterium]